VVNSGEVHRWEINIGGRTGYLLREVGAFGNKLRTVDTVNGNDV